jgi:hypothetical protein
VNKAGRALIVPPTNEVSDTEATGFWFRLLRQLAQSATVTDAVKAADTSKFGWKVIGDPNVKVH